MPRPIPMALPVLRCERDGDKAFKMTLTDTGVRVLTRQALRYFRRDDDFWREIAASKISLVRFLNNSILPKLVLDDPPRTHDQIFMQLLGYSEKWLILAPNIHSMHSSELLTLSPDGLLTQEDVRLYEEMCRSYKKPHGNLRKIADRVDALSWFWYREDGQLCDLLASLLRGGIYWRLYEDI